MRFTSLSLLGTLPVTSFRPAVTFLGGKTNKKTLLIAVQASRLAIRKVNHGKCTWKAEISGGGGGGGRKVGLHIIYHA